MTSEQNLKKMVKENKLFVFKDFIIFIINMLHNDAREHRNVGETLQENKSVKKRINFER